MEFFIADTHFFHAELLTSRNFSPRPFDFLEEEHPAMIQAWNARVGELDTVYHLGDVAMLNHIKPPKEAYALTLELLMQLNGHIVLIKGNHDTRDMLKYLTKHNPLLSDGLPKFSFNDVGVIIKANHHQFFLTHYPLMFGRTDSSINLHGHIHHYSVGVQENINVGVDSADLDYLMTNERPVWGSPLNLAEIELMIQRKHDAFAKGR
ncbi:MAG: metallophosphoesterase [Lactobacillaceae bacterium]|jgi:calcineurin-like phosphoesterase family protein|nr:metallophosphoesterase [Lactobacillaceae bacterium]